MMDRSLSSYAFNNHSNDAKLYNGVHDLETTLGAVLGALKAARDRLYIHQGKTTKTLVAQCDAAIALAARHEKTAASWRCGTCGAAYAEYVNGCPHCWEHGTRSKVGKIPSIPEDCMCPCHFGGKCERYPTCCNVPVIR